MNNFIIAALALLALLVVLGGIITICYLSAFAAKQTITFLLQDSPQEAQAKAQRAQEIAALLAETEQVQRDLQKSNNDIK